MKNISYKFISRILIIAATIFLFTACGGGGGSSGPTMYTVGGDVTGLDSGTTLTIALNKTQTLNITNNIKFTFPAIQAGSPYVVTIVTQPAGQTCGFAYNQSGTSISKNITDIKIVCSTTTYTVGGTVSGLPAGQLINLIDNDNFLNTAIVGANGSFQMLFPYVTGQQYSIVVNPLFPLTNTTCAVNNGTGRVGNSNITDLQVVCGNQMYNVSGTISAPGVIFDGKASIYLDDTSLSAGTVIPLTAGKSTFQFTQQIPAGSIYIVTVKNDSQNYVCSVNNNSGINVTSDITNVAVVCSPSGYTLSVDTSGAGLNSNTALIIENENYYNGQVAYVYPTSTNSGQMPKIVTLKNNDSGSQYVIAKGGSYQLAAFAANIVNGKVDSNSATPCLFANNSSLFANGTNINSNQTITGLICY